MVKQYGCNSSELPEVSFRGLEWALMLALMAATAARSAPLQAVSANDVVSMRQIGDPADLAYVDQYDGYDPWLAGHRAEFSPDGRRAAVIVTWGDTAEKVVRAEILVYDFKSSLAATSAVVAERVSTSNRPPIQRVRWLGDGTRLTYLAETSTGGPQVFSVDTTTRVEEQLTHAAQIITSYDITPSGARIAFLARDASATNLATEGTFITDVNLTDLIAATSLSDYSAQTSHLFVKTIGKSEATQVPDPTVAALAGRSEIEFGIGRCNPYWGAVSISPDGEFAVRTCVLTRVPARWQQYAKLTEPHALSSGANEEIFGPALNDALGRSLNEGQPNRQAGMLDAYLQQHIVFDLTTGRASVPVDAPLSIATWGMIQSRAWLPDSHVMAITNTFLPSSTKHADQPKQRPVVSVNVSTGEAAVVTLVNDPPKSVRWDDVHHGLAVDYNGSGVRVNALAKLAYSRPDFYSYAAGRFVADQGTSAVAINSNGKIRVFVDEALNRAPKLVAQDLTSDRRAQLLDPNPFLRQRDVGKIEQIEWTRAGTTWLGGIYYPPRYNAAHRYPLVIQTHGYTPSRYSLFGDDHTGMAAEPIAALGIIVVQIGSFSDQASASQEMYSLEASQGRIEALIDSLDKRGLIDRSRIGLSGFSSTCFPVKYFLTHSDYQIAAALVADGTDSGYFQYLLVGSQQGFSEDESQIGSAPFGPGLKAWLEKSPGFLMDQIREPIRIEANRIEGVAYQWEFYAGLRRLDKPVEFFYYPQGSHSEVRVADWLASAQGAVDWYGFWLLGRLPDDPTRSNELIALRKKQIDVLTHPKAPRILWTATTEQREVRPTSQ